MIVILMRMSSFRNKILLVIHDENLAAFQNFYSETYIITKILDKECIAIRNRVTKIGLYSTTRVKGFLSYTIEIHNQLEE